MTENKSELDILRSREKGERDHYRMTALFDKIMLELEGSRPSTLYKKEKVSDTYNIRSQEEVVTQSAITYALSLVDTAGVETGNTRFDRRKLEDTQRILANNYVETLKGPNLTEWPNALNGESHKLAYGSKNKETIAEFETACQLAMDDTALIKEEFADKKIQEFSAQIDQAILTVFKEEGLDTKHIQPLQPSMEWLDTHRQIDSEQEQQEEIKPAKEPVGIIQLATPAFRHKHTSRLQRERQTVCQNGAYI